MGARAMSLVIDARPQGACGPLAAEQVLGRSVLGHLVDLAAAIAPPSEPVIVHTRVEDQPRLRQISDFADRPEVVLDSGPPRPGTAVLRTDRLYDARRLRRVLFTGGPAESAVVWRLDQPEALLAADEELTRRLTYQPLGRYWAFPLARRLAELLRPTAVRPNALTIAGGALMLGAAGLTAAGADAWGGRLSIGLALAIALVLDTADGRLARLQGTCSAFGRWLDQVLDELADLALHAAIAWAAFVRDGQPVWLLLGILFVSGKYLFLVQSLHGADLDARTGAETQLGGADRLAASRRARGVLDRLTEIMRLLGHADLRWHLWIALALVGRLDLALAFYAAYFPVRALLGIVKKGVRHA
jgi:phosphatidylglycerophosphate synthase